MSARPRWTREWLEANGYDVYGPRPESTRPAPAPVYTKPASELRRGDQILTSFGWAGVCSAEQVGETMRVRVPGPKWLFFVPTSAIQVDAKTFADYEPRRRVLRAVELVHNVLRDYFTDDASHEGARARARNLVGGLDGVPTVELAEAIELSLREKGLASKDAAERCRVAFLMAMGGH